jgi:hypothetical protein
VSGAGRRGSRSSNAIVGALPLITIGSVLLIGLIVALHFRSFAAPAVALAAAAGSPTASRPRASAGRASRPDLSIPREVEPVLVVLLLGLVTDIRRLLPLGVPRTRFRAPIRVTAAMRAANRPARPPAASSSRPG